MRCGPLSVSPLRRHKLTLTTATPGEQESRGQHHLIQLSRLASSLNRTLVLPNLATSRFMTCGTAPFSSIYDPAGFASLAGEGVGAFIEQGAFERWLEEGDEPHSARAVCLRVAGEPEPLGPTGGAFVPDRTLGGQPRAALCLDEARLAFGAREPLVAVEPAERDAASGELLENLRWLDEEVEVEVLLVHWDLRAPLLGDESDDLLAAAFVYAPEWHALAGAVLGQLGDAVGVHWRMEGVEAGRLDECGSGLVEALVGLKEGERAESALHSVYFATDYPLELLPGAPSHPTSAAEKEPLLEGGAPWLPAHSDTLSAKLTPSHHTAMTHFLSSFAIHAAPAGLTLNTYRSVLPSLLPSLPSTLATLAQTPAAPAIVSQLVLQRTRRFLAGEARPGIGRERCARRSSWTRRVVVARERAHEGGRGSGDAVGWWSTDGSIE